MSLQGELCDQRNAESVSTTTTRGAQSAPAVLSRVVLRKRIALIPARGGGRRISATGETRKCEFFHVRLVTRSPLPPHSGDGVPTLMCCSLRALRRSIHVIDEPASSRSKPAMVPAPEAATTPPDVPTLFDW